MSQSVSTFSVRKLTQKATLKLPTNRKNKTPKHTPTITRSKTRAKMASTEQPEISDSSTETLSSTQNPTDLIKSQKANKLQNEPPTANDIIPSTSGLCPQNDDLGIGSLRNSLLKIPAVWSSTKIKAYFEFLDRYFDSNGIYNENIRFSLLAASFTEEQSSKYAIQLAEASLDENPYTTLKKAILSHVFGTSPTEWLRRVNALSAEPNERPSTILSRLMGLCPLNSETDATAKAILHGRFIDLLPEIIRPIIHAQKGMALRELGKYADEFHNISQENSALPKATPEPDTIESLTAKVNELLTAHRSTTGDRNRAPQNNYYRPPWRSNSPFNARKSENASHQTTRRDYPAGNQRFGNVRSQY